jgi:catechol 2,3-dioxygenase-like lactoylglutathione lyase family enzyme
MTLNNLQPFHLAVLVKDLDSTRKFYGELMGFNEGRSNEKWIDWDFFGHQFVTHLNPKYDGKNFTEYTAKDGLGGTEFWGLLIEKSGIIWVTARGYTTRFDPSIPQPNPNAFKVFTPADGFTCCVQSMYQDNEGRVWWGTGQGLYSFDGSRFYQVKQSGPW